MRPLYLVLALASSLLLGCGEEPVRWHADERFTDAERAEIVRGFVWLGEASGRDLGGIAFDYRASPLHLPGTIRREPGPVMVEATGARATGFCTQVGSAVGTVQLDPDAAGLRYLAGLTAHELAHCALGLHEDRETDGIMRVLEPMRWTEREDAQLARD